MLYPQTLVATMWFIASMATVCFALNSNPKSFTLQQHARNRTVARNGPAALARAMNKYGVPVPSAVMQAAATVSAIAIPHDQDKDYTLPVQIGDQTFQMDLDTGSADFWVFSTLMQNPPYGHNLYDVSSGVAGGPNEAFGIIYADNSAAKGVVYYDSVAIGDFTMASVPIGAATAVAPRPCETLEDDYRRVDGLIGFASSKRSSFLPQKANTWWERASPQLDRALFTASLKHDAVGSYEFGEIDPAKYTGEIGYVDVDFSEGYWVVHGIGYAVNGYNGRLDNVMIDTGSTIMYASNNSGLVPAYYNQVEGSVKAEYGYEFPCNVSVLPDLYFEFGGTTVVVPGEYMNAGVGPKGGHCAGTLQEVDDDASLLGDVFLKSVFAVFDQGKSRFGVALPA